MLCCPKPLSLLATSRAITYVFALAITFVYAGNISHNATFISLIATLKHCEKFYILESATLLHGYNFNSATYYTDAVTGQAVYFENDYVTGQSAWRGYPKNGAYVQYGQINFATVSDQTSSGRNPHLSLPAGMFDASAGSISIEAWYSAGAVNTYNNRIFQFGPYDHQYDSWAVCRNMNNGLMQLQYVSSPNGWYFSNWTSSVYFNSALRYHVVMTISTSDIARLYVNGNLFVTNFNMRIPTPNVFFVGGTWGGSPQDSLVGSVDEFRIWSGALSASQVAANYAAGPGNSH